MLMVKGATRHPMMAGALVIAVVAWLSESSSEPTSTHMSLRTRELVIEDEQGAVRAVLGMQGSSVILGMRDSAGGVRVSVEVTHDGSAALRMMGDSEDGSVPVITLHTAGKNWGGEIASDVFVPQAGSMVLRDPSTGDTVAASVGPGGGPHIIVGSDDLRSVLFRAPK